MIDRVPLSEAITEEIVESSAPAAVGPEVSQQSTLDEMRDMGVLSSMLGFVHGFEGMNNDADLIMRWAREKTGEFSGTKLLSFIKDTIKGMGTTEKGKSLLTKLRLYSALDTRQSDLQKQKDLL